MTNSDHIDSTVTRDETAYLYKDFYDPPSGRLNCTVTRNETAYIYKEFIITVQKGGLCNLLMEEEWR